MSGGPQFGCGSDGGHECPGNTVSPYALRSPARAIAQSWQVGALGTPAQVPRARVTRGYFLCPRSPRRLLEPRSRGALSPPSAHSAPHPEFAYLGRPQPRTPVSRHRPREEHCHLRAPRSQRGGGACWTDAPALGLCCRLRELIREARCPCGWEFKHFNHMRAVLVALSFLSPILRLRQRIVTSWRPACSALCKECQASQGYRTRHCPKINMQKSEQVTMYVSTV